MKRAVLIVLFVSLFVAGALSFMASERPDGLEYVLEELGFEEPQEPADDADADTSDGSEAPDTDAVADTSEAPAGVMPDYEMTQVEDGYLKYMLPGVIGVLATLALAWLLGVLIKLGRPDDGSDTSRPTNTNETASGAPTDGESDAPSS